MYLAALVVIEADTTSTCMYAPLIALEDARRACEIHTHAPGSDPDPACVNHSLGDGTGSGSGSEQKKTVSNTSTV